MLRALAILATACGTVVLCGRGDWNAVSMGLLMLAIQILESKLAGCERRLRDAGL